ncbi:lysophospholipase L1-like esterase [Tenacibaculum adriaticum]|uniref:Lysophospholipase L1-like esterase n=1 Tax=Tenacibaculum adriaticum TaxID=413713 RepID=A0A5S5DVY5_9FLAO|nr:GSCFA domain-containing protein [Tenacibaculum adriaticum]TYQ00141.1 lysophospholipase L1-like esterase [Tenacibaculum adriaticum]
MQLQTQIPLKKQPHHQIDYNSKLLLLGSCFSENIGDKLAYFKFQSVVNPFGILFHPKAIEKLITDAINQKTYSEEDIFSHNELWHSFDAHSSLSSSDKNELIENLNSAINSTFQQLKEASHIVITLGTAWVYRFIETDSFVANCHKITQKKFLKEILSVDEISESLESIIALIKSVNNKASIILTVSPVRHLKDGFIENQQSKAHLLSAIHTIVEPRKNSHYFPSYEIMMDELRDYRFYTEDMIHPNQTAVNYIWGKFQFSWISENANTTMNSVDTIQKGLAHRPFNPNTEQHQQFLKNLQQKKETLQKAFPFIQF